MTGREDRSAAASPAFPASPMLGRAAVLSVVAVVVAVAVGCETSRQTSDGRPMPPTPTQPVATPTTAPVNAIALIFGPKPVELDGDGIPDRIEVDAYLFARPYPQPILAPGVMVFEVYAPGTFARGEQPLGEWRIGSEQLVRLADRSVFGPCFRLRLDLREIGLAPFPLPQLDLRCRFEPSDGGAAVESRGVERISMRG